MGVFLGWGLNMEIGGQCKCGVEYLDKVQAASFHLACLQIFGM